jgi:addiction module HigA family antidote
MGNPIRPEHPGKIIQLHLKSLNLTQKELASALEMMLPRLNEIINRKRKITSNIAVKLSRVLGESPAYWMSLQTDWDVYQVETKHDFSHLKPLMNKNQ